MCSDPSPFADDPVFVAFRSLDPPLTRFPHCLFKQSEACLKAVFLAARTLGGLWGKPPIADASGEPYTYIEHEDGYVIDDFRLWNLPENQNYLMHQGTQSLETFTMVIPSSTRREVLLRIYDVFDPLCNPNDHEYFDYDYDTCVQSLHLLIEDLEWAYVPMGPDVFEEHAIFVAADRHATLIQEASLLLRKSGVEVEDIGAFGRRLRAEWGQR